MCCFHSCSLTMLLLFTCPAKSVIWWNVCFPLDPSLSQTLSRNCRLLWIRTSAKRCKCLGSSDSEVHRATYRTSAWIDGRTLKEKISVLSTGLVNSFAPVQLLFDYTHSRLPSCLKSNMKSCRNKHPKMILGEWLQASLVLVLLFEVIFVGFSIFKSIAKAVKKYVICRFIMLSRQPARQSGLLGRTGAPKTKLLSLWISSQVIKQLWFASSSCKKKKVFPGQDVKSDTHRGRVAIELDLYLEIRL